MKINKKLLSIILILNLAFIIQVFGRILIDVDNPYQDVFVFYSGINYDENIYAKDLYGNFHENHQWRRHSYNPHEPKSLYFQIGIKNKQNENIKLKKHSFDKANGPLFHEEVCKEEFIFKEKKGEITYKTIVKIEEYPSYEFNGKEYPSWTEIDSLKIKILYAELNGKEMKLDGGAYNAIQKNCTVKESLKQNCLLRGARYQIFTDEL